MFLSPRRRTSDSHAQGVRWKEAGIHRRRTGRDQGDEDEKNKFEELKVVIVAEDDAEYIKKS